MLAFRQTLSRLHANDSELSKISLDDLPLHVISNEELAEFGNLLCHSKHIRKVELDISRFSASGTGCAALQRFLQIGVLHPRCPYRLARPQPAQL